MEYIGNLEKQVDLYDQEKNEVNAMKEEIVKNLEKMLKKIDLDQNPKTVKFDILSSLKILLQKNEVLNTNPNINNNNFKAKTNDNFTNQIGANKSNSFLDEKNNNNYLEENYNFSQNKNLNTNNINNQGISNYSNNPKNLRENNVIGNNKSSNDSNSNNSNRSTISK